MKRALLLMMVVACGKSESKAPPAPETKPTTPEAKPVAPPPVAKPTWPKVDAVCKAAWHSLGYVECVETEMPELTTPAGKVVRVMAKDDATASYVFALVAPSGEITIGHGGSFGLGDELTKPLDLTTAAPALLATIYAELSDEPAIVRCLPGSNDTLPENKPCKAPAIEKNKDGKTVLRAVIEEFPDPRGGNRDTHWILDDQLEVGDGRVSGLEGDSLATLDPAAPRPASLAPLPTMSSPPDWAAKPEVAPAATSDALCKAAQDKYGGFEGRTCKAYGYPSLALPTGTIYYLANDAGYRWAVAFQKTDGTIVEGYDLDRDDPLVAIIKDYDPAKVSAATFVTAALLLHTYPAKIRCLDPGDQLPENNKCEPPTVTKTADGLHVEAILEELPVPDQHGMVHDPAIRSMSTDYDTAGGSSGGGTRLVDLRPTE